MSVVPTQDRLIRDHQRVLAAAENLNAILAQPAPADSQVLAAARWQFASTLMQHLALKERYIYSKLDHDPRAEIQSYRSQQKAALVRCFAEYNQHMESWPTSRAIRDWAGYQLSAMSVVTNFVQTLEREKASLFDFIDRFAIDISAPSAVTSNWIRNAFQIKDKVDDR